MINEDLDYARDQVKANKNVKALFSYKSDEGLTLIDYAVVNDRFDVVEAFAEKNVLNHLHSDPMILACLHQRYSIVRYLFENGYTPQGDYTEKMQLYLVATVSGPNTSPNINLAEYLIKKGAPVSKRIIEVAEISPNRDNYLIRRLKKIRKNPDILD